MKAISRSWRSVRLCCGLAACFATSSCYKATVVNDQVVTTSDPTYEEWTDFFIFGLVGTEDFDVRSHCNGPAGKVRTGGNAGTWVVSVLTIGIYTPRKVYIHCAGAAPGGSS